MTYLPQFIPQKIIFETFKLHRLLHMNKSCKLIYKTYLLFTPNYYYHGHSRNPQATHRKIR